MKKIKGGVCAAKGFSANSVVAGIKKGNTTKKDLTLIVSDAVCTAASVYTTNKVKGAPLTVTKENLENGLAQAIICNSGNANTCNDNGIEIAKAMCHLVADNSLISENDVIVASTGVIGHKMIIEPIEKSIKDLFAGLGSNPEHSDLAFEGISTTDTMKKEAAVEFEIGGHKCHIGGICKGSGMIHPNMATMLGFITTDVKISAKMLELALKDDVNDTFNMVSVDGDTSTNDMVTILANGNAENDIIAKKGKDFDIFKEALHEVTVTLSKAIAKDGEGASKLLIAKVSNAKTKEDAKIVAKSVICSSLFKAAMFGSDANWGRVLCAIGYSEANVDINLVDVAFTSKAGTIAVCKNGAGVEFSEDKAKKILTEDEITIDINLNSKDGYAEAYGCDLTYDYVKINGDYRS